LPFPVDRALGGCTLFKSYVTDARSIRRETWIVLLSAVALGFTWQGLSDTIINLFLVRIGFGPEFVGTSAAVANLGYALASVPGAMLSRRIGARRGMMLGALVWVAGSVLLAWADVILASLAAAWIIVTRLLASGGLALNAVSSQPYLTAVTSESERPLAFALVISLRPLGGFFGSMVGGLLPGFFVNLGASPALASLARPRAYGLTLAAGMAVCLPIIWLLWTLPRDDPRSLSRSAPSVPACGGAAPQFEGAAPQSVGAAPQSVGAAARDRDLPWARLAALSRGAPLGVLVSIALVCFLRVSGEFTARNFFSIYADARWAIPTAQIGGIIALSSLLTIPAPLVTPALVKRHGRVKMIAAGATGVALSIALLGLGPTWAWASVAFIGLSVLGAVARSIWSLVIQESVAEPWRPAAAGVANLFSGLGTMTMSSVGGILAAGVGYSATFLSSAAMVAAGAVTVWVAFHRLEVA
jgi:MFS family permease